MSPSRSSSASRSPVDAPDGTAARPDAPPSSATSTSTVGFPRESRISRPCTLKIFTRRFSCPCRGSAASSPSLRASSPSIRLGLEFQCLIAERSDERLVIGGDNDDSAVSHGVAPFILFDVVADQRAARNQHVAVDDGPSDPCVPSHAYTRHQYALLDVAEAVNPDVRAQHAAENAAAGDDAAGR